jgi:hypothetical protein
MKKKLMQSLVTVALLSLVGCAGESGESSSSGTTYSGPGSFWTAEMSSSSFKMERRDNYGDPISLTVNGSISSLASGYKMLTVSSATGTNPPTIGEKAYGLEIPGFFTLVKPLNSVDDKLLPMLASGNCPTGDVDYNWIVTGYGGSSNLATAADIVGFADFTHATTQFGITEQYSLNGTNVTSPSNLTGSCSNGFMQIDTNSDLVMDTDMWISASGAAMLKTPEGSIIVAMPAESFSAGDLMNKSFSGLVFNEVEVSNKVQPIYVDVGSLGTSASAGHWTDVEANTKDTVVASLSFTGFDSPRQGFVQVGLSIDTNSNGSFDLAGGNMICQYKGNIASSGKDLLFCAGHIGGDTTNMFNLLLVSQ